MYNYFDPFSLLTRPSVYVISDSQLETFKRNQAEAEITELNSLIDGHKQSIERLERTIDTLRKDYPKLEPTTTEKDG